MPRRQRSGRRDAVGGEVREQHGALQRRQLAHAAAQVQDEPRLGSGPRLALTQLRRAPIQVPVELQIVPSPQLEDPRHPLEEVFGPELADAEARFVLTYAHAALGDTESSAANARAAVEQRYALDVTLPAMYALYARALGRERLFPER